MQNTVCELRFVQNWEDFVQNTQDLRREMERPIFRGQADSKWTLVPKIERWAKRIQNLRADKRGEALCLFENDMTRAVVRHLWSRTPSLAVEQGQFIRTLSLLQHHGAPTRLLDFTDSEYVAAFFALEDYNPEGQACPSVWVVDSAAVLRALWQTPPNWPLHERKMLELAAGLTTGPDALNVVDRVLGRGPISLCLAVRPDDVLDRMASQQALFLLSADLSKPFIEVLQETLGRTRSDGPSLVKIMFKPDYKRIEFLRRLKLMNITREMLFPGLDGFATSLGMLMELDHFGRFQG